MSREKDEKILMLLSNPETKDEGFTIMMDTYKERIYWYVRRLVISHEDAEDVLQETFLNAYRFIDSFRGHSGIYTWLYKIAGNECVALFRRNKKKDIKTEEISLDLINKLVSGEMENSEAILIKFQEAILRLPEKQRMVFNLRYYDELSYEEMSEVLGSSVNTLKTNYHYATEKIKTYFQNQ